MQGDIGILKEQIAEASKIFKTDKTDGEAQVRIVEGTVQDALQKEKVFIGLCFNQERNSIGDLIVSFKNKVIELFRKQGIELDKNSLNVKLISSRAVSNENDEFDYDKKAKHYIPVDPLYTFDRVILPNDIREKIAEAAGILQCENKVFKEWGLYEIQPHPSTSLNFYGPSGTGKTMAAEAVAHKLGKKILKVSYADVESKYHGEGPKMVKAIFLAASNADAVLFFDEADSLLSKRLTNVSQGSEQAINSMRSQLLICLEEFRGIVIFATNLVVNYDQAFLTRFISIEFKNPDVDTRETIWNVHIKPLNDGKPHKLNIPLSENVNARELAECYDFTGREIRNAVVSACVSVALAGRNEVAQADFIAACEKISVERDALAKANEDTKEKVLLKKAIEERIKQKDENVDNASLLGE